MLFLAIALVMFYSYWPKGFWLFVFLLIYPVLVGINYSVRALVGYPIASLVIFFSIYFGSLFCIERIKWIKNVMAKHVLTLAIACILCSLLAIWSLPKSGWLW